MSRLFITAYRNMAVDDFGRTIAAPATPPLSEAFVEITHENIQSDPLPTYTSFVCIMAEDDCAIAFGPEPVADPDYHRINSGERLFYGALAGHKIAVIEVVK